MRFELVAAILGSPHGFDVILVRNAVCFLLERLAGEPSAMTQRPVPAGFVRATVAQEKSEKLLASPHQLRHGVDPGAHQITHRLVNPRPPRPGQGWRCSGLGVAAESCCAAG